MLTERFDQALVYAHRLHARQFRKGPSAAPYIAHLMGVCSLVLEHGGTETEAIGALLHDSLEDIGLEVHIEISRLFGPQVLDIVKDCSDSTKEDKTQSCHDARLKALDWLDRKTRYLEHLIQKPEASRLVSLADKLYNAQSIVEDWQDVGDGLWERFTGGKWGTLWYYRSLNGHYRQTQGSLGYTRLLKRFDKMVSTLSQLTQSHAHDSNGLLENFKQSLG